MLITLAQGDKSLFEELFEYISDKYFSIDMPYLENFTIKSNALISLRMIIIGITIGIIIASIATAYNKRHLGSFIRNLIKSESLSPESAKTLEELGYSKKIGVKLAIRSGGTLSRWARCAEEDIHIKNMEAKLAEFEEAHKDDPKSPKFKEVSFKRDCNTMHFYLPEEKKYAAEVKFDAKGTGVFGVLVVSIFAIVLCMFLCYILPDAIKYVDNFITVMNK